MRDRPHRLSKILPLDIAAPLDYNSSVPEIPRAEVTRGAADMSSIYAYHLSDAARDAVQTIVGEIEEADSRANELERRVDDLESDIVNIHSRAKDLGNIFEEYLAELYNNQEWGFEDRVNEMLGRLPEFVEAVRSIEYDSYSR